MQTHHFCVQSNHTGGCCLQNHKKNLNVKIFLWDFFFKIIGDLLHNDKSNLYFRDLADIKKGAILWQI